MKAPLKFPEPVILIGGGPVTLEQADIVKPFANTLIAADGGADKAPALGLEISAIIGDLDSVSIETQRQHRNKIVEISEQNSTDFEKCIYATDAPLYLCLGFLGGRLDHELAALNTLTKYPERKIVLIGGQDITVLCPSEISIDLALGTRVSLFPLTSITGVQSSGLEWSLDGLSLASNGKIATSNKSSAPRVTISYDSGALLLILPIICLSELLAALS